jgi:hypothetical protein
MFLFTLLLSCGDLLLPPLEVTAVNYSGLSVTVSFSKKPSEYSIKKALSLFEEGTALTGTFSFYGNTVEFIPFTGIKNNYEYTLIITTTAEDESGNSLLRDYQYQFFMKTNINNPRIISITPINESILLTEPDSITINFSGQIDITTFNNSFSIAPAIDHFIEWHDHDTTAVIVPQKPITEGTRYTITISTSLMDVYRNPLLESFNATFLYGTDKNPPELDVRWVTTSGDGGVLLREHDNREIPSNCSLELEFDEQFSLETIAGFIQIAPSISITVTQNFLTKRNVSITFNQTPEWNRTYTITFRKGITDNSGNSIQEDIKYLLTFNNEHFKPIIFISGYLNNDSLYEPVNPGTDFSTITLSPTYFPQSVTTDTEYYLVFGISQYSDTILLSSAMQAVFIGRTNACMYISLRAMTILTETEYNTSVLPALVGTAPPDCKICAIKVIIEIENTLNNGLVLFTINKDIKDNLGNTLPESILLTYNKQ